MSEGAAIALVFAFGFFGVCVLPIVLVGMSNRRR